MDIGLTFVAYSNRPRLDIVRPKRLAGSRVRRAWLVYVCPIVWHHVPYRSIYRSGNVHIHAHYDTTPHVHRPIAFLHIMHAKVIRYITEGMTLWLAYATCVLPTVCARYDIA